MKLLEYRFENYKAFKYSQIVKIKPLTIFIGKNNSGKSAAIRLPLLLFQAMMLKAPIPLELDFNNLDFGSNFSELFYNQNTFLRPKFGFQCIMNQSTMDLDITLALLKGYGKSLIQEHLIITKWELKKDKASLLKIEWIENNSPPPVYRVTENNHVSEQKIRFHGLLPHSELFSKDVKKLLSILKEIDTQVPLNYFPPFRDKPQRTYSSKMSYEQSINRLNNQTPQLLIQAYLNEAKLIEEIGNWYEKNLEGWRLELIEVLASPPLYKIVLSHPQSKDVKVNIVDTGHGTSQVFPLVLSALLKRESKCEIDIIEEPELHLHPGAHGNLVELFATAAISNGVNYLIETHSEVFLLRLQRLIVEQKSLKAGTPLSPQDVVIYWVNDLTDEGCRLTEITINENGELSDWPEGVFFDEDYIEAVKIREAQDKRR